MGTDVDHPFGVGGRQRQRLLAQDVLAGAGGGDRPLGVEVVRQRDVDGVHVRVGEQRLVRRRGRRDAQLGRDLARQGAVARGDGDHVAAGRFLEPGMTFLRAISAVERIPQRRSVIVGSARS